MPGAVTIECPAKVNLALAVEPPTADGMHPILSWMLALSFSDQLEVERLDDSSTAPPESVFDLSFADDAPRPSEIDWPLADDLAVRAHGLMEKRVGRKLPVRVTLRKRIPTGAGLGGGSSDAAGVIVAVDQLFDLGLTAADRHDLAGALGSDVHFALEALSGQTSAIVRGLGNVVEPAPPAGTWPIHLVLVLPPFGCPTGPVYSAFDELQAQEAASKAELTDMHELVHGFSPPGDDLFNDLARPAASVQPGLGLLLDGLRRVSPYPPHVTGSGAACFVVVQSAEEAHAMAESIAAELDVVAIATQAR
ncbi:MAG: hypothetical protein AAF593_14580 [Planctomycetota bacterium]